MLIGLAFGLGLHELYPFLAVTERVPTATLVIDGWLPTYDLEKAAEEYRSGGYEQVLVVRASYGFEALDHDPGNVQIVQQVLRRFGIPADHLNATTFPGLRKDRTQSSALAVKDWFERRGLPLQTVNLFTLGAHARRSRLIYRRVFGDRVAVGVIAAEDPSFDRSHWWRFSDGIREVPFEGLAYLFVRCKFDQSL